MPSWIEDDAYGWSDSPAARYQAAIDREFAERLHGGWQAPDGWRRPVLPMCERHGYGVVDGLCGVCVQEASLSEREPRADKPGDVLAQPDHASRAGQSEPASRSESDERAA